MSLVLVACAPSLASDDEVADEAGMTEPASTSSDGTADLPPTDTEGEVLAWLREGSYKRGSWSCEAAPHAARSPSPHGKNRICSNAVLAAHGSGEFPLGAAGVKELYDASGTRVTGHAVYRKIAAGGGEAWHWFEEQNGRVVANGAGDHGTPKTVCANCHAHAGSDQDHSGHDFVYTQVRSGSSSAPAPAVIQGMFVPKAHPGSGSATLDEGELRLSDFSVTNGPALDVVLTINPNPSSKADVEQGYLDLGALQGTSGNQAYSLPAGTDARAWGAVAVYCVDYGVVFTAATLH